MLGFLLASFLSGCDSLREKLVSHPQAPIHVFLLGASLGSGSGGMRFHTRRVGVFVCLTVGIWVFLSVTLYFTKARLNFQQIGIGSSISKIWKWRNNEIEGRVRLVVFGDSWVDDTVQEGEGGKGKSWTEVFCQQVR